MADLINLNRVRKRKDKEDSLKRAEMNRLKHGRTKLERDKAASEASRSVELLDQHKLSDGDAT